MTVILKPKITDAGLAAAINADANGFELSITHIALGTGKYSSEASGAGMTAMADRKEQVQIGAGVVSGTGGCRMMVRFDAWSGTPSTYEVTEIGFYAGDPAAGGVLFAVFATPADVIVVRNLLDYVATFTIQLTRIPSGSVTVSVNPEEARALALIALHEAASDPHTQYVKKSGDTSTAAQFGLTASPGDNSPKFATTEFVKRQGLSFPASGGVGVSETPFSLPVAALGRWIEPNVNGGVLHLPPATQCPSGGSLAFRVPVPAATIVAAPGDAIVTTQGESVLSVQVSRGETFVLTRNATNNWYVTSSGARQPAGMVAYFPGVAPPGWIKLNGVLLSRSAYPSLWSYAQSSGLVSDADWMNNGYSGRFSSGVAGDDFRIPDSRGVFLRSHDDGRGIDTGRVWGTYQDHANRSHGHGIVDPGHNHPVYDPGHVHVATTDSQGQHAHGSPINVNGGFIYGGSSGIGNDGSVRGIPSGGGGFGSSLSQVAQTGVVADHTHNVSMNKVASGLAVLSQPTGISILADGSEARPRNLAWPLFIKF